MGVKLKFFTFGDFAVQEVDCQVVRVGIGLGI